MIDEWSGTLTLTEASSRELMRVLEKQDAEFMNALFNGKCGFTLKCTDGRSVELVPKADRKTEPNNSKVSENPTSSTRSILEQVDKDINVRCKDEPQTDCNGCKFIGTYDTEFPCANCSRKTKDYYATDEPQTDCAWK